MESPEEKLKQQAAIARIAKEEKKTVDDTRYNAISTGFDASSGQSIIQLSDGSIEYASSDTSGAIAIGDNVLLNQGAMHIDALPHIKKRPTPTRIAPQLTHHLKVLAIFSDNAIANKYYFYVGSESQKVKSVWTNEDPSPSIFLDVNYKIRVDNLDPKKSNGWAISSLWQDRRDRDWMPPGICISLNANEFFRTPAICYDNLKVAGAYFFAQVASSQLPLIGTAMSFSGSISRNFQPVPQFGEYQYGYETRNYNYFREENSSTILTNGSPQISSSTSFMEHSYYPTNGFFTTYRKWFQPPIELTYPLPVYEVDWFSGSGRSITTASINFYAGYFPNSFEFSQEMSFSSNFGANCTQRYETIYKQSVTTATSSLSINRSLNANLSKPYGDNTNSLVSGTGSSSYIVSSLILNPLPTTSAMENIFSEESGSSNSTFSFSVNHANSIHDEIVVAREYSTPTQPSGNYYKANIHSIMDLFPENVTILPDGQSSDNSQYQQVIHRTCLVSPDGKEGIVRYQNSPSKDDYIESLYYYSVRDGILTKTRILYSGQESYLDSYVTGEFYQRFTSDYFQLPTNLEIGQIVSFTESRAFGYLTYGYGQGSRIQYEFKSLDVTKYFYGAATIIEVSESAISFSIDTLNSIDSSKRDGYGLDNLFVNNFAIMSCGYVISDFLNTSYDSAADITLKVGTITIARPYNQNAVASGSSYYVAVDTYKLTADPDGLYLKRQPIKFIKCPAIAVPGGMSLDNVVFAYDR